MHSIGFWHQTTLWKTRVIQGKREHHSKKGFTLIIFDLPLRLLRLYSHAISKGINCNSHEIERLLCIPHVTVQIEFLSEFLVQKLTIARKTE